MIAICIPVYNHLIADLIKPLQDEITNYELPAKIIVLDDYSIPEIREKNRQSCPKSVNYIELEANIGRAAIRNRFLHLSTQPYLLFLDCDAKIIKEDFIRQYLQLIEQEHSQIIFGGICFNNTPPPKHNRLRWLYGIKRESATAEKRHQHPNRSFKTKNFLISRQLFEQIQFDERITGYGHEDTLFGYRLQQAGIMISHANNPVMNAEPEDNATYLEKTEKAMDNLFYILQIIEYPDQFAQTIRLIKYYRNIQKSGLAWLARFSFPVFGKSLRRILIHFPSLPLFDLYKLLYFSAFRPKINA
ncbi:MAG: glycosyltransferase family 2 protein [Bacteroidota bacterium]